MQLIVEHDSSILYEPGSQLVDDGTKIVTLSDYFYRTDGRKASLEERMNVAIKLIFDTPDIFKRNSALEETILEYIRPE